MSTINRLSESSSIPGEYSRRVAQPVQTERKANLLGVGVLAVDLAGACTTIERALKDGVRGYVCLTGVHGVMEAHRDPEFRAILARALMVAPDGMPTVWVGHRQGHSQMQRVFGPDLMLELCRRSVATGTTHFLYGGKPGVAEQLANNLRTRFPGINIVGSYTPPFRPLSPGEESSLQTMTRELKPDLFWVGLGTPKQERFMAEYMSRLECGVLIGVGAAFDIHTGNLQDAPKWIKSAGLQWAHRLCQEPRRLWKRYLINNSTFIVNIAMQLAGIHQYEINSTQSPGIKTPGNEW